MKASTNNQSTRFYEYDQRSLDALSRVRVSNPKTDFNNTVPSTLEQYEFSPNNNNDGNYQKLYKEKKKIKSEIQKEREELAPVKIQTIEKKKIGNGLTVYQIDPTGKIVQEFSSAKEAGEFLGIKTHSTMLNFLNKESDKIHNGFYWIYQKDYKTTFDYNKQTKYLKYIENKSNTTVSHSNLNNKTKEMIEKKDILLRAKNYSGTSYRRDLPSDYNYAYNHGFSKELLEILSEKEVNHVSIEKDRILLSAIDYEGKSYSTDFKRDYDYAYRHGFNEELLAILSENGTTRKSKKVYKNDVFIEEKKRIVQLAIDYPEDFESFKKDYPNEYKHIVENGYKEEIEALGEESVSQLSKMKNQIVEPVTTLSETKISHEDILNKSVKRFETSIRELSNGYYESKYDKSTKEYSLNEAGEKEFTTLYVTFKINVK